ncbi:hypothetical protein ABW19_dt0206980 [Dactylella cylindrospora]|nr:hypothetical protein ABW19_dt0206980 [Dactylella cylindrospora]
MRVVSIYRPYEISAFITSTIFLTLAPSLQASNLYMLTGRIICQSTPRRHHTSDDLWCRPRFLAAFFVAQDVIAFMIQFIGIGAMIIAIVGTQGEKPNDGIHVGYRALILGFGVQIFWLCALGILLARYQFRSREWWDFAIRSGRVKRRSVNVILYVLYSSMVLLLIRTLYRLNEFVTELKSDKTFLVTQEWPFWLFEMAAVFAIYLSHLIPQYPGTWFAEGGPLERDFESYTESELNNDAWSSTDMDINSIKGDQGVGLGIGIAR